MGIYSHIKMGLMHLDNLSSATGDDLDWVGDHYDWIITSRPYADDYTQILSRNPNIIFVHYVASENYKPTIQTGVSAPGDWVDEWTWIKANGHTNDKEDLFLHYKYDKVWGSGSGVRYTTLFYPGTALGTIPGSDTIEPKNRAGHYQWGSAVTGYLRNKQKDGVALSRDGAGTVTATKTSHGYSVGWRLNVYSTGDTSFNGDNFEILTVPTTSTFTYAQAGASATTSVTTRTMSSTISAIQRVNSTGVVTVTIANHTYEEGDLIYISNCTGHTSFHGTFLITGSTTNNFTYDQAGADETGTEGVATYFGWDDFAGNPQSIWKMDFYQNLALNGFLRDQASTPNKMNGIHWDNIAGVPLNDVDNQYAGSFEAKCKEFLDEIGTYPTFKEWWSHYKSLQLVYLRDTGVSSIANYTSPKTAYNSMHGDSFRYTGRTFAEGGMNEFYHMNGPDLMLLEDFFVPNLIPYEYIDSDITWLKRNWELMDTYGKKLMWEQRTSYGTFVPHTWEVYSGNIYYTDAYAAGNKMLPTQLYFDGDGTNKALTTRVASLDLINSAGEFFYDQSNGRLYGWFTANYDPRTATTSEAIRRFEPCAFFGLAAFHVFGNHANGYYFPYETGTAGTGNYVYNQAIIGDTSNAYWFNAIGNDIGQPAPGGLKVGGGYGTDLWGESTATSSKSYEMWRDTTITTQRLYARKFANGYAIVRFKHIPTSHVGDDPRVFTMPFSFQQLRADSTVDPTTNTFTLAEGQGIILLTDVAIPSQWQVASSGFVLNSSGTGTGSLGLG